MDRILNARKRYLISVIADKNLVIIANCTKLNDYYVKIYEDDTKSISVFFLPLKIKSARESAFLRFFGFSSRVESIFHGHFFKKIHW